MYDFNGRGLYWPHTARDNNAAVRDYLFCAQNRTYRKHKKQLKLFFPEGALAYVSMDKLGLLTKTTLSNHFVVVLMVRYKSLTRAMLTVKSSALQ